MTAPVMNEKVTNPSMTVEDRKIDYDISTRRCIGRFGGLNYYDSIYQSLVDKVSNTRDRIGGIYLDFKVPTSLVNQNINTSLMPGNTSGGGGFIGSYGGKELMDYILTMIGKYHPFTSEYSMLPNNTQKKSSYPEFRLTSPMGVVLDSGTVDVECVLLGMRQYLESGFLGRGKAAKKLTEWAEPIDVPTLNSYLEVRQSRFSGMYKDVLLSDLPLAVCSDGFVNVAAHSGYITAQMEAISTRLGTSNGKETVKTNHRVRISYDPDDALKLGHFRFDQNACFGVYQQSSTAPVVIATDEESVVFLVYNDKDEPIGRAWGRVLYDSDGTIINIIFSNVYPNTTGKQRNEVWATMVSLMSVIGLVNGNKPYLSRTDPDDGGWIYFNGDAYQFKTPDSTEYSDWVIDNEAVPKGVCSFIPGTHKCPVSGQEISNATMYPVWSSGYCLTRTDAECQQGFTRVNKNLYEKRSKLGVLVELDLEGISSKAFITDNFVWCDGVDLGLGQRGVPYVKLDLAEWQFKYLLSMLPTSDRSRIAAKDDPINSIYVMSESAKSSLVDYIKNNYETSKP